ncbi:hypothetical protein C482_13009 [Natrialba chahannaoensis JCM 10990]|uniref:Uncharacterized protein n=1 Tax=Natrialba chahannaoensis JCM 10990 TaxID=1227492 RepID=M0AJH3_9EURY|nr:hypothetical protein [Natrialba chahannaoensis]ELY97543.1 hypothetical protein C482_13009 [Natrialba chahannaoensis JCM 10990]
MRFYGQQRLFELTTSELERYREKTRELDYCAERPEKRLLAEECREMVTELEQRKNRMLASAIRRRQREEIEHALDEAEIDAEEIIRELEGESA